MRAAQKLGNQVASLAFDDRISRSDAGADLWGDAGYEELRFDFRRFDALIHGLGMRVDILAP